MATLTQNKIQEIEAKASDVLASTFGEVEYSLPINLGEVAESENLTLKEAFFVDNDAIGLYDRAARTIYIKRGSHLPRMSFTIAHEIGHHILHEHVNEETFWRRDVLNLENQDGNREAEANWFAASLLMPKHQLTLYWKKTQKIEELAEVFGVSDTAMLWRLKNLNFIKS